MGIDASIYSQVQPLNIMGNVQSGLNMRQMMDDHQIKLDAVNKQKAIDQAYQSGITQNDDGTPGFDRAKSLSELAKVGGKAYIDGQQNFQQQDAAKLDQALKQTQVYGQILKGVVDQPTYDSGLAKLSSMGVDISKEPKTFDPGYVKQHTDMATTYEQGIQNKLAQQNADDKKTEFGLKLQEIKNGHELLAQNRQQQNQDRSDKKDETDLFKMQTSLQRAQSQPAVAQAEKDLYATKKLDKLINLYGDANKLSPVQVQLAATEMAKIASGGVPTDHELQGLNPSAIPSKLATLAQFVSNKPESAEAGEFLKSMQDYTKSLKGDAQDVIKENYGRILDPHSNRFKDNPTYQGYRESYVNRFLEKPQAPGAGGAPKPATVIQNGNTYNLNPTTGQYE